MALRALVEPDNRHRRPTEQRGSPFIRIVAPSFEPRLHAPHSTFVYLLVNPLNFGLIHSSPLLCPGVLSVFLFHGIICIAPFPFESIGVLISLLFHRVFFSSNVLLTNLQSVFHISKTVRQLWRWGGRLAVPRHLSGRLVCLEHWGAVAFIPFCWDGAIRKFPVAENLDLVNSTCPLCSIYRMF